MLRIGKLTDYATLILCDMAYTATGLHTAVEIAGETGIALPTVSKILKLLHKAHIVTSTRGAKGGYQLATAAHNISIANIICAIEGPIALTECLSSRENCDYTAHCSTRANWSLINSAVNTALQSVSLADMMKTNTMNSIREIKIPVESICHSRSDHNR